MMSSVSTLLGRSSARTMSIERRTADSSSSWPRWISTTSSSNSRRPTSACGPSTVTSLPRTASDASGNAASIWRRLASRWPSSAAMRCPPGTTTVCILASEVIGPGPAVATSTNTVATPRPIRDHQRRAATMPRMDFEIPDDLADLPRRARRLHRAGDQAARAAGRQHPLLRPPPRGRPHRLGPRRPAERGVGGAAARGPAAGRRGRPLPLPVPEGVRRQGRHQPRHGGHPRAPRRARASACTATCRTSTRSSATTSACC